MGLKCVAKNNRLLKKTQEKQKNMIESVKGGFISVFLPVFMLAADVQIKLHCVDVRVILILFVCNCQLDSGGLFNNGNYQYSVS